MQDLSYVLVTMGKNVSYLSIALTLKYFFYIYFNIIFNHYHYKQAYEIYICILLLDLTFVGSFFFCFVS